MTDPKLLTSETPILDGEVYRHDWEGSPRFYLVRIYPWDPRECPSNPHLYIPRVIIHVELEGDATVWADKIVDADSDYFDAVYECVTAIEDLCSGRWEQEREAELRDCLTAYERQFGF